MSDYRIPEELRYSSDDEWVKVADEVASVGVTDFAQQQLGDIVYVELPELGASFAKGDAFGVIESVKAVSDLFAPVSGEVIAINEQLADSPEIVNEDCYGDGWMIRLRVADTGDLDGLLDANAYGKSVAERDD